MPSKKSPPPNVVLIFSDDHGWPFYGFMCPEVGHTPALDRLAREGVVFSQSYVSEAHCQRSHRSTLTGLNLRDIRENQASPEGRVTTAMTGHTVDILPKALQQLGYKTFGMGKWWQGPMTNVFDNSNNSTRKSFAREVDGLRPAFNHLEAFSGKGHPWFFWCAPDVPHAGYASQKKVLEVCVDRDGRPYLGEDDLPREDLVTSLGPKATAPYLRNVRLLDHVVRRVLEWLEDTDLRKNTLILYLSDNGAMLQKSKAHFTEAGIRTPLIANFPQRIPARGDEVDPALVGCIDIYPTLIDYAGGPPPPVEHFPDARSFRALAEGHPGSRDEWRKVFFGNPSDSHQRSVRDPRYKLYKDGDPHDTGKARARYKLFDLAGGTNPEGDADPFELTDLTGVKTALEQQSKLEPILNAWYQREWSALEERTAAAYPRTRRATASAQRP